MSPKGDRQVPDGATTKMTGASSSRGHQGRAKTGRLHSHGHQHIQSLGFALSVTMVGAEPSAKRNSTCSAIWSVMSFR
jgi:hypothetical protein